MKRIISPARMVLCVLFLLPSWPTNAQQTGQKNLTPVQWEKLGEDVQVLRVWQLEGTSAYPQVSVLRVSDATYLKFFQDPQGFLKFVNANKVFSKDVIVAGPWVTLSSYVPQGQTSGWLLTLYHGKLSTMLVSALPSLIQEEPAPKKT